MAAPLCYAHCGLLSNRLWNGLGSGGKRILSEGLFLYWYGIDAGTRYEEPEYRNQKLMWQIICAYLNAHIKSRRKCSGSSRRGLVHGEGTVWYGLVW